MSRRQISLGIVRGLFVGRSGRRLKENLLSYLYTLPTPIILAAFHFLPVGYTPFTSACISGASSEAPSLHWRTTGGTERTPGCPLDDRRTGFADWSLDGIREQPF
jgi:hypothetical protein